MISERDVSARTAAQKRIRAALLTPHAEETPLPIASRTQELDPGDILEVRDMAEVIARAEQIVAAPRSSRPVSHRIDTTDIFDALVRRPSLVMSAMSATSATSATPAPTDDAMGPAMPAVRPAPHAIISTLALAQAQIRPEASRAPFVAPAPIAASSLVLTVPIATEDDAYYTPGGRVRSLADVTLDGYRPEPTLLVRARARRHRLTWLIVAALIPVVALAGFAFFGHQEPVAAASTTTIATATLPAAPKPAAAAKATATAALPVVVAAAAPKSADRKPAARGAVPTFDVNSLPTAAKAK